MDEKFEDLDREIIEDLGSILMNQVNTSFAAVVGTDKWLRQHNFLINAGGAAAVLAYLSSENADSFLIYPLVIFLAGVVASGIEIRYLLKVHRELQEDARRRRGGFVLNQFNIAQAGDVQAPKPFTKNMSHYSGLVAQAVFAIGSTMGILWLLCA